MSVKELAGHAAGRYVAGPPISFPFLVEIMCQASRAGTGIFDIEFADGMGVPEGYEQVSVAMSGDARMWSFEWAAPDPVTGKQTVRIRTYDDTGAAADPDQIRITIERLTRI